MEELRPILPDDWGLVMTTGEQLSWVVVDKWYFSVLQTATNVFVILFRHFYHRQQHEEGLVMAKDMGSG
jgi:hypothetical protein